MRRWKRAFNKAVGTVYRVNKYRAWNFKYWYCLEDAMDDVEQRHAEQGGDWFIVKVSNNGKTTTMSPKVRVSK